MKKQTAVEWLFEQFENGNMYNVEDAQRIKHQAKEMEKQQSKRDYEMGQESTKFKFPLSAEQYYNETYGK